MSRLSDDEKRVFTDRIAELETDLENCHIANAEVASNNGNLVIDNERYRNLYHLECTKVMSREAIIEQLSETELAKDVTRLEAEIKRLKWAIGSDKIELIRWRDKYRDQRDTAEAELSAAKTHISEITETIRSQREENTLLAEHNQALQKIERLAKLYLEHGEPELADELDALLTGGDDD